MEIEINHAQFECVPNDKKRNEHERMNSSRKNCHFHWICSASHLHYINNNNKRSGNSFVSDSLEFIMDYSLCAVEIDMCVCCALIDRKDKDCGGEGAHKGRGNSQSVRFPRKMKSCVILLLRIALIECEPCKLAIENVESLRTTIKLLFYCIPFVSCSSVDVLEGTRTTSFNSPFWSIANLYTVVGSQQQQGCRCHFFVSCPQLSIACTAHCTKRTHRSNYLNSIHSDSTQ